MKMGRQSAFSQKVLPRGESSHSPENTRGALGRAESWGPSPGPHASTSGGIWDSGASGWLALTRGFSLRGGLSRAVSFVGSRAGSVAVRFR